ncbi:hypothetical protein BX600DRAFT_181998 [Xylariales sp. PMI_506]|nr:hypothetical protein BX600DRAFT_181998 [Xylariales sp. PMI_506]
MCGCYAVALWLCTLKTVAAMGAPPAHPAPAPPTAPSLPTQVVMPLPMPMPCPIAPRNWTCKVHHHCKTARNLSGVPWTTFQSYCLTPLKRSSDLRIVRNLPSFFPDAQFESARSLNRPGPECFNRYRL